MNKAKNGAFTLIEIMIVVTIIALLVTIAIPNMMGMRQTANETATQATLTSFAKACESYAASTAAIYPTTIEDLLNNRYFSVNLAQATKNGYTFSLNFANNGYTVTATPLPNAGRWDYQVTTGLELKKRRLGENDWQSVN